MQKNNYIILFVLCGFSVIIAMEQPGIITRSRALYQRTSRNRILSEIGIRINELNEESKQQHFTNYWHSLIQLKSAYVHKAELSGNRCVSSYLLSLLCILGVYQLPYATCQICGGAGAVIGCLYGTSECIAACNECANNETVRNRIEYVAEQMGWQWKEFQ